jgi:hypothetical protein
MVDLICHACGRSEQVLPYLASLAVLCKGCGGRLDRVVPGSEPVVMLDSVPAEDVTIELHLANETEPMQPFEDEPGTWVDFDLIPPEVSRSTMNLRLEDLPNPLLPESEDEPWEELDDEPQERPA